MKQFAADEQAINEALLNPSHPGDCMQEGEIDYAIQQHHYRLEN